jgi:DNA polymerase epsilon subunit 3
MPPKAQAQAAAVDDSPVAVQQRANTVSIADFELPKTTLTKLAKGSVSKTISQ